MGRVADRCARRQRRGEGRCRRRRGRCRPAPLLAERRSHRVRQRRRRLAGHLDSRSRRWQPATGAAREARARGTGVGPGAALVRVVTERERDRMVPQRGRFRPARDRGTGRPFRTRVVEGLAPRHRLERGRHRVCAFGWSDAGADRGARGERFRPPHARARTGWWFRTHGARRGQARDVAVGQRDGARTPLASPRTNGNQAAVARADPRWPHEPSDRRLERARSAFRAAGLRRPASQLPRLHRLRAGVRAGADGPLGGARRRRYCRGHPPRDQGRLGATRSAWS